jgi:hypothetical protein
MAVATTVALNTVALTTASGVEERIKTPFGFGSLVGDIINGIDLNGKYSIVTGGSSGIGIETARALAKAGANVTLAVRRLDAAEEVAAGIRNSTGNSNV